MANLIVSVIAIVLAAAAAMLGLYYGGSAYATGQVNAQTSALLTFSPQVAVGFQNYLVENSNNPPTSWAAMINAGFLKTIPVFPILPGNNRGMNSGISMDGFGTYWIWGDIGAPSGSTPDPNAAVCQRILKTALGTMPATIQTGGVNHAQLTSGDRSNGKYGCEINDSGMNDTGALNVMPDNFGVVPDGHYAFFYRMN